MTKGFALLENAPTDMETLHTLVKQIGYIKETHYGKTFDVRSVPNPESVAYTSVALPFHTDLPYRRDTPGTLSIVYNSLISYCKEINFQ